MTDSGVKRDRPPSNEVDENENNVKPSPFVLANQKKRPTFLWRKKLSVLQKSAKWGKLQNTDPTVCQSTFRMCVFVLVDFLGTAFFSPPVALYSQSEPSRFQFNRHWSRRHFTDCFWTGRTDLFTFLVVDRVLEILVVVSFRSLSPLKSKVATFPGSVGSTEHSRNFLAITVELKVKECLVIRKITPCLVISVSKNCKIPNCPKTI